MVDNYAFRILKYDKDRKFLMSIGEPGTSSGHDALGQLYYPQSIALDPSGEFLFVADTFNFAHPGLHHSRWWVLPHVGHPGLG